ncbi:predicted protein [Streptomyces viridochromogenes DSM 40736]|uniref:Predicted protein n=1 Tax=Streptomyces viridochromogenes (strain DSM 40736 / JCM 4977 / BCRC 1201 / Tue 494) TaxID=591159 RepID=D9XBM4_STRVT|nr:M15 family metallopeptidase [Streptomyces viridochromogenes]EFL36577.1 predicted protein [Streptomyces viridochromogenes DSM 40736]
MNHASWESVPLSDRPGSGPAAAALDEPPTEIGHWSYPVVSPLRAPHEILALAESSGAGPVGLRTGETWTGTPPQEDFLRRVLAAHMARSRSRKGRPGRDLEPGERAVIPGTNLDMRADAAAAAGRLLAAANQALAAARGRGDEDARRTRRITVASGYRGSEHQERLWRTYFGRYYEETAAARSGLPGGPHGEAAVRHMIEVFRIPSRIAAPGYSNHQNGIAIDLLQERDPADPIRNSTRPEAVQRWRRTWFFQWLQANAGSYGFAPYEREPWHWEYRSGGAPRREAEAVEHDRWTFAEPTGWEESAEPSEAAEPEEYEGYGYGEGAGEDLDARWGPEGTPEAAEPEEGQEPTEWQEEAEGEEDQWAAEAAPGEDPYLEWEQTVWGQPESVRTEDPQWHLTTEQTDTNLPTGPFGSLVADLPGGRRFSYTFTRDDVFWAAKLVSLEAGGTDDAENAAVIWAMLNRYALFAHKDREYPTFTSFIRAYSTTLQPVLRNPKSAEAHMHDRDFVPTGGHYKGTTVPRGQLGRHLKTQAVPWSGIKPESAKRLALRALTGGLPNPGIGNATEFASTRIFWQRRNHTKAEPTRDQWLDYTKAFARHRKLRWIGDRPGLDQRANAFFVHRAAEKLPPDAVRVLVP